VAVVGPQTVWPGSTLTTYRLLLWELVYHDCVVTQWYWGDYNNKLPAVWDRRDLYNALYGTPPMFISFRRPGNPCLQACLLPKARRIIFQ
jgi:Glycosyl hydrolases related to GH101 family, GH129